MRRALRAAPVAAILSEEAALPEILHPEAPLCVAIDPLDGSANLENNISVGTIFSIRPRGNDIISTFFEPGTAQRAAGFFVYGPQTTLVLALQARRALSSSSTGEAANSGSPPTALQIPPTASGIRHQRLELPALGRAVRASIDDCLEGESGAARGGFQHALDRLPRR